MYSRRVDSPPMSQPPWRVRRRPPKRPVSWTGVPRDAAVDQTLLACYRLDSPPARPRRARAAPASDGNTLANPGSQGCLCDSKILGNDLDGKSGLMRLWGSCFKKHLKLPRQSCFAICFKPRVLLVAADERGQRELRTRGHGTAPQRPSTCRLGRVA